MAGYLAQGCRCGRSVPLGQTVEAIWPCAAINRPTQTALDRCPDRDSGLSGVRTSLGQLVMLANLLRRSVPAGQTYQAIWPCATNNRPKQTVLDRCPVRDGGLSGVRMSLGQLVMPANLLRRSVPAGQTYQAIRPCATINRPTQTALDRCPDRDGGLSGVRPSLLQLVMPANLLRRSVPAGQT